MELEERIIGHFHSSMDICAQTIEHYTPLIAEAAEVLLPCLVSDHKILCAGNGVSAALATQFSAMLMNRFRHERPGLPCAVLSADSAVLSGIANDAGYAETYARQIQALGQAGDILLVISPTGRDASLVQAIQAAHDREMLVIALTGRDGGNMTALLRPEEIEICIPAEDDPSVHFAHTLILHTLTDLIEYQLFGAQ
ncbi:MAG: SIS domain-containing protein [Oceanospirillaceae bacterium]|nr:SIS domain-containing protein [Oceanospirillaceae bacterium]